MGEGWGTGLGTRQGDTGPRQGDTGTQIRGMRTATGARGVKGDTRAARGDTVGTPAGSRGGDRRPGTPPSPPCPPVPAPRKPPAVVPAGDAEGTHRGHGRHPHTPPPRPGRALSAGPSASAIPPRVTRCHPPRDCGGRAGGGPVTACPRVSPRTPRVSPRTHHVSPGTPYVSPRVPPHPRVSPCPLRRPHVPKSPPPPRPDPRGAAKPRPPGAWSHGGVAKHCKGKTRPERSCDERGSQSQNEAGEEVTSALPWSPWELYRPLGFRECHEDMTDGMRLQSATNSGRAGRTGPPPASNHVSIGRLDPGLVHSAPRGGARPRDWQRSSQ